MKFVKWLLVAVSLGVASIALAQEPGTQVWGVRVLATDAEAIATFYAKTFGMSEVGRPVNSATAKELILNFGRTAEVARKATTPPIVIYTRPAGSPAGAMPSLILRVPDLDKALEAVKANGGTLVRAPNRNAVMNLAYAMVKDPDGNQIELIMDGK
jgi:predicted enzyme related to lactoylglutathione lyase